MAMVFLLQKMQFMLKCLCRAFQLCSTTALLVFIIYVNYPSAGTQWDGASQNMLRPVPPLAACSSNMCSPHGRAAWRVLMARLVFPVGVSARLG